MDEVMLGFHSGAATEILLRKRRLDQPGVPSVGGLFLKC
jgi:hypothetical protein